MVKISSGGDQHQHGGGGVGGFGRDAIEQAAGDRADDGRRLPGRRVPGNRVAEIFRRHQIGEQRRRGRSVKGARHAEQRQHGEDRQRTDEAAQRQEQKDERTACLDHRRQRHDQAAAEAVGDDAGDQHQQQRRQELDDADNAEIEGIARQIIDLPADGDGHDHGGEGGEETRRPIAQEGAVAESGVALVGWRMGLGCHGYGPVAMALAGGALPGWALFRPMKLIKVRRRICVKIGPGSRDFRAACPIARGSYCLSAAEMASRPPRNSASFGQPKPTRKKRFGMSNQWPGPT